MLKVSMLKAPANSSEVNSMLAVRLLASSFALLGAASVCEAAEVALPPFYQARKSE
jgi:hypothetical protein